MSIRGTVNRRIKNLERSFETYNRIEVSKSALRYNYDLFARLTKKQIIPVLKSNAYGHGIELVAKALKSRSFPYLAVDGYYEALRIREVSKQPVLIMGAIKPENFSKMHYDSFAFVVHDLATLHALGKTGKKVAIHLEINTGMNRHGISSSELSTFLREIEQYPIILLEGMMSHLADSDGSKQATVDTAVRQFDQAVGQILQAGFSPRYIHIGQTAGSVKAKSKYANTIRLGIGLYGINPFPVGNSKHKTLSKLRPALRLLSTITKIHELQPGDKVSYNYMFTAPKAMRIGVLPLGYYEGVNRALSNAGVMQVGKRFASITGRVCMNHTMISLEAMRAKVGDEVVVYSSDPKSPNSFASIEKHHGLFSYNLLTSLSQDVRRVLVD